MIDSSREFTLSGAFWLSDSNVVLICVDNLYANTVALAVMTRVLKKGNCSKSNTIIDDKGYDRHLTDRSHLALDSRYSHNG